MLALLVLSRFDGIIIFLFVMIMSHFGNISFELGYILRLKCMQSFTTVQVIMPTSLHS